MTPATQAYVDATKEPGYTPPAADLGYCACGTVWNIEAIALSGFERETCPDCGSQPEWIERANQK